MYEAIWNIYKFLLALRLRIKLMPEKEFLSLIETLDSGTALYALIFRYI